MPKTAKKTSRTSSRAGAKKSGAKTGTAKKRKPASSAGGRSSAAKGRATKSKSARRTTAKNRGVRAARGRRQDAVSKPLKYTKYIDAPEDHEDRPGQSLATRNHEVIRQWAEGRQAVPATVESTERDGGAGVLRLDFPGYGGQRLQEISWEEWFRTFDERDLVFLFQEHKADGSVSNFFRLNRPDD